MAEQIGLGFDDGPHAGFRQIYPMGWPPPERIVAFQKDGKVAVCLPPSLEQAKALDPAAAVYRKVGQSTLDGDDSMLQSGHMVRGARYVLEETWMAELVCDFCLGSDPVWDYPTAPIDQIDGPSPFSALAGDGFACCAACHALLLRGDIVGLAERIVREQPINVPPGSEAYGGIVVYPHRGAHRGYAMQAILRFLDARTGPPVPL